MKCGCQDRRLLVRDFENGTNVRHVGGRAPPGAIRPTPFPGDADPEAPAPLATTRTRRPFSGRVESEKAKWGGFTHLTLRELIQRSSEAWAWMRPPLLLAPYGPSRETLSVGKGSSHLGRIPLLSKGHAGALAVSLRPTYSWVLRALRLLPRPRFHSLL